MRILILVSQILDAEETVRIRDGFVDLSTSKLVVDTMDEYGVEAALRLREAGSEAEIIALAIGSTGAQDALRTVLSMGVDRAIHVSRNAPLDPLRAGQILATIAKEEKVELVFVGGQQASWDSQAVGAAAAESLGWPQVTWVNALELKGQTLVGEHDVDAGSESFQVDLPALITTQQGLNEPRYPTLPNIIKSRKKELRVEPEDRFGDKVKARIIAATIQSKERLGKVMDGKNAPEAAAQLVAFLRDEAKVIS